jgi:hypothetical protein
MTGYQGPMAVEEGAKTSVELATLPPDGFTGKFVHLGEDCLGKRMAWQFLIKIKFE